MLFHLNNTYKSKNAFKIEVHKPTQDEKWAERFDSIQDCTPKFIIYNKSKVRGKEVIKKKFIANQTKKDGSVSKKIHVYKK